MSSPVLRSKVSVYIATSLDGYIARENDKLHTEGVKHVYLDGGLTICKFLELGLVDQMILTVIPTILGRGIKLFTAMNREHNLHLNASQSYPNGLVQLH